MTGTRLRSRVWPGWVVAESRERRPNFDALVHRRVLSTVTADDTYEQNLPFSPAAPGADYQQKVCAKTLQTVGSLCFDVDVNKI
jgi:hypothetical protein